MSDRMTPERASDQKDAGSNIEPTTPTNGGGASPALEVLSDSDPLMEVLKRVWGGTTFNEYVAGGETLVAQTHHVPTGTRIAGILGEKDREQKRTNGK